MAADDRALRDRFEKLQVRTKVLREQLSDPDRLNEVRTEVSEQVARLRSAHAAAAAKLAVLKPQVEDARVASMQVKREQAEASVLAQVGATGRMSFTIAALLACGAAGLKLGALSSWPEAGYVACAVGAGAFVALVWKMASDLRR